MVVFEQSVLRGGGSQRKGAHDTYSVISGGTEKISKAMRNRPCQREGRRRKQCSLPTKAHLSWHCTTSDQSGGTAVCIAVATTEGMPESLHEQQTEASVNKTQISCLLPVLMYCRNSLESSHGLDPSRRGLQRGGARATARYFVGRSLLRRYGFHHLRSLCCFPGQVWSIRRGQLENGSSCALVLSLLFIRSCVGVLPL